MLLTLSKPGNLTGHELKHLVDRYIAVLVIIRGSAQGLHEGVGKGPVSGKLRVQPELVGFHGYFAGLGG
jgi:hypothetical protein